MIPETQERGDKLSFGTGTWRSCQTPRRLSGDSGAEPRDRQVYVRPSAWRGQCSAGRTSARSPRSARSAVPTKSSSSSTPTETIRSSITSARSATSAATRACLPGTCTRPAKTTPPRNEPPGDPSMTEVVIRAFRVSGLVPGPCPKCSKEERGLVMFEDYALGWECLVCGELGRADRVEWIEGKDPALADLHDEEE